MNSSSPPPSFSSSSTLFLFFLLKSAKAMQESVLSPPPLHSAPVIDIENRISHSLLLLLLVILAVIFFVSGLFHLLVRCCLMRPIAREPEEHRDDVTALQGQLQQLFHLHDAGVDQSFIDMLPVFLYKAIGGLKDPFDCAVCLCEFAPEDKLRLLPKCSHAFHLECIDTWLLSNSTCPLCRSSLLNGCCSPRNPMVLVLESASDDTASGRRESARVDEDGDGDDDEASAPVEAAAKEAVAVTVAVKLGKFKSAEAAGEEATSSTANASNSSQRRCFSMGSYEYVMEDDDTMLQVSIEPPKKPCVMKSGHRITMSECDCHSRREGLRGLDRAIASQDGNVSAITSGGLHRKESLSASKIWLQAKEKSDTSRRAISFRLPLNWAMSDRLKLKSNASPAAATASEFNVSSWGKTSSEVDLDVEVGSSNYSVGSRVDEAPSFTRRTLLWLLRRQNRAENHL